MAERFRLLLRAAALMLLVGAVPLFMAATRDAHDVDPQTHLAIALPAMMLLICLGTSAALWAFSLMPKALEKHPEDAAAVAQLQEDVAGMFVRLDELAASVEQLTRTLRQTAGPAAPQESPNTATARTVGQEVINRLERSLQEIRDLAVLTER